MTDIINYYQESLKELNNLSTREKKPRLLLHTCCAPCTTFPLQWLSEHFDITLYYANSNIYPSTEYQKRLDELRVYLANFNTDSSCSIKLICPNYDNAAFTEKLKPFKDIPEGGQRCFLCYSLRLQECFRYAKEEDFEFVTTVMTISRHKNSQILNQLGSQLERQYAPVRYFFSDFKKNKGQEIATQLSKKYSLYRQAYCGCIYSYEESLKRIK